MNNNVTVPVGCATIKRLSHGPKLGTNADIVSNHSRKVSIVVLAVKSLRRAVDQSHGIPRRGTVSACVSGRRSLERIESFAGAAGERDDPFPFVQVERLSIRDRRIVRSTGDLEHLGEVASASPWYQGESVV